MVIEPVKFDMYMYTNTSIAGPRMMNFDGCCPVGLSLLMANASYLCKLLSLISWGFMYSPFLCYLNHFVPEAVWISEKFR